EVFGLKGRLYQPRPKAWDAWPGNAVGHLPPAPPHCTRPPGRVHSLYPTLAPASAFHASHTMTLPALAASLALLSLAAAPPTGNQGVAYFESKVRPVLIKHCYSCHSEDARKARKLRGGLALDTRQGLRDGGDSGQAIVPGDSAKSLLIQALRKDIKQMPPKGRLPASVIADLAHWVDMGAPDPRDGSILPANRRIDLD